MPDIPSAARRHGFSEAAASALADAIHRGGGGMAQFSHPELGGMGQWTRGGMIMIGAMNDHALKARVAALADAIAAPPSSNSEAAWWPAHLGNPSRTGAQNGVRYAVFPEDRRIVIEHDGRIAIHDSGPRRLTGVSQQQSTTRTLVFSGPDGAVSTSDLPEVSA
jgi:hypothetical protein